MNMMINMNPQEYVDYINKLEDRVNSLSYQLGQQTYESTRLRSQIDDWAKLLGERTKVIFKAEDLPSKFDGYSVGRRVILEVIINEGFIFLADRKERCRIIENLYQNILDVWAHKLIDANPYMDNTRYPL